MNRLFLLPFILSSIHAPSFQSKDSILSALYQDYKSGAGTDSTLLLLHHAGFIDKEELDSTRFVRLKKSLKYKFALKCVRDAHLNDIVLNSDDKAIAEESSEQFRVLHHTPAGALESFNYFARYDLYPIASFYGKRQFYLLAATSPFGLDYLFLLNDSQHRYTLLDSIQVYPLGDPEFKIFDLFGHSVLRLRESEYGTGYINEREVLIGVIREKFHNLFATNLLQANDWNLPDSMLKANDFARWSANVLYVHRKPRKQLEIRKHVSEDIIRLSKDNHSFGNAPVVKHIRSWVEIFVWDKKTKEFIREKRVPISQSDRLGKH